jgi:asparagine synthase (glutamine-hydrolysing)
MKNYQGREKGLLRQAMTGLLAPRCPVEEKEPVPKDHNPSFVERSED